MLCQAVAASVVTGDVSNCCGAGDFRCAYVFIATEKLPRTVVSLAGAAAMVLFGATDGDHTFFSEQTGIDWNVIFLLLGMMIIVGILRQTGVFEFLAIWSAKRAHGRPFVIMTMTMMIITAVLSAVLDNVTTVLLVMPVTILVCDRLGVPAIPYLIAELLASNIGGAATLIGDPPNIIIGSRAGLSFNQFLVNLGPIIAVLLAMVILLCWLLFRHQLGYDPQRVAHVMALNERETLRDHRLLAKSLIVVGLVLAAFIVHTVIGLQPGVVAMLGAGLLVILARVRGPFALVPRQRIQPVAASEVAARLVTLAAGGARGVRRRDGRAGTASTGRPG
jgi:Na+/H+ antiporter NhaD/arsenite permease-like protein